MSPVQTLVKLNEAITACRQCDRLVAWREQVATDKRKQYQDEVYWGKAVPSFGDPSAQLLIVGLAPAAHGANRTGRMFTGDNSGLWLYRALHKAGFANQPSSKEKNDGLKLTSAWITAICHCAPPQNKVTSQEVAACQPFLREELRLLSNLKVVICLGSVALNGLWATLKTTPDLWEPFAIDAMPKKPAFGHNVVTPVSNRLTVITSYHPSQQNTFTGKLTEPMLDALFASAKSALHSTRREATTEGRLKSLRQEVLIPTP